MKIDRDYDFFQDTSSVTGSHKTEQRNTDLTGDETSRLFVKKTIVVGNVSKWVTIEGSHFQPSTYIKTWTWTGLSQWDSGLASSEAWVTAIMDVLALLCCGGTAGVRFPKLLIVWEVTQGPETDSE